MKTKVVHMKRDPYDVYVGRGRGSRWGNPFSHKDDTLAQFKVATVEEAIEQYRSWLWSQLKSGDITLTDLAALSGKTLGCWCAPGPCHGDVLAAAAEWADEQIRSGIGNPSASWRGIGAGGT